MPKKSKRNFKYAIRKTDHFDNTIEWLTGLLERREAEKIYNELTGNGRTNTMHTGKHLKTYELLEVPVVPTKGFCS